MMRALLFNRANRLGNFIQQKTILGFLLFLAIPILAFGSAFWPQPAGGEWFSFACHQNPNRGFVTGGVALPLCARCLGLYAGIGLAGLFLPAGSGKFSLGLLVSAALISVAFLFLRSFWPVLDFNIIRLASGLLIGAGLALFLKSFLKP